MSRRPAHITQADIARAIRAAKQEGATEVEVRVGDNATITIRITAETRPDQVTLPKKRDFGCEHREVDRWSQRPTVAPQGSMSPAGGKIMPRPRPPYLHREVNRHGRATWYVRIGGGPRKRLRADYGTSEFWAEYRAAISGVSVTLAKEPNARTLAWLIERYRASEAWQKSLSMATRRQRENIFLHVLAHGGEQGLTKITKQKIVEGRDARSATPAQARNFLDAMRGLFRWALEAGHVGVDPTEGIKNPPRRKDEGFLQWKVEDQAAYEARWPLGTRQRVWMAVLRYTGLRRGDAALVGRQHVAENPETGRNEISIKTEKSGRQVEVTIPICDELQEVLDAGPVGDMCWIVGTRGGPLTKEAFGNVFKEACVEAGVRGSAHGLRKLAATTVAENGASEKTLNALFGWTGSAMASLYTRKADRKKLGRDGGHLLVNKKATSAPAPHAKVRAAARKTL